ncbi:MAG: 50S ribosomal protein L3 [Candidatus Dadabacteria bacterium]|nr:MAG: 50S ribosomal protein L3 [Candidatus Dadabacteria bacterium]
MSSKQYREGLLARKLGMTQVFDENGECVPVTVLQAGPCVVLDIKTVDKHGYSGVQFGFIKKKQQRTNKPMMGHFAKAGKGAFRHVKEVRCNVEKLGWEIGQEVKAPDIFVDGELVDVTGVSIGRGFSGVVRRFGVKGQPATRGTHEVRRNIGAIGCRKFPGRVLKNQKMPGRYGGKRVTVKNLKIVKVDGDDNLILVRGGVPGPKNGILVVKKAVSRFVEESSDKAA